MKTKNIGKQLKGDGQSFFNICKHGFGFESNHVIYCLGEFKGFLYAGTRNMETGAHLYRTNDLANWHPITQNGFENIYNTDFYGLKVFKELLYIGTFNPNGAEIYCSSDGRAFNKVIDKGGGDETNVDFYNFIEFNKKFYTGTCNLKNVTRKLQTQIKPCHGGSIFQTKDGIHWKKIFNNSNINHNFIRCFEIYNNKLFASTGRYGSPWILIETKDGKNFIEHDFNIQSLYNDCPIIINFKEYLYCFVANKDNKLPFKLYIYDSKDLRDMNLDGFGNENNISIMSAKVIHKKLWVTTRNFKEGLEIWFTIDGFEWINYCKNGIDDNIYNENCLYSLFEYKNYLAIGLTNYENGAVIKIAEIH